MTDERTNERTLEPGEYSSGTLRDRDIADMFDTIGLIVGCEDCRLRVDGLRTTLGHIDTLERLAETRDALSTLANMRDIVASDLEGLYDHVNDAHTPEGFYFGAHCGDGACFGIWEVES